MDEGLRISRRQASRPAIKKAICRFESCICQAKVDTTKKNTLFRSVYLHFTHAPSSGRYIFFYAKNHDIIDTKDIANNLNSAEHEIAGANMDIITITKKTWKKSIYVMPFPIIKIVKYPLRKLGLRKGLTMDWCSKKEMPFLSAPKFLKHKGFELSDMAEPYYELLYLPFNKETDKPSFKENVKTPKIKEQGFVLYYAHQCPYTAKYVPLIEDASKFLAKSLGELLQTKSFNSYPLVCSLFECRNADRTLTPRCETIELFRIVMKALRNHEAMTGFPGQITGNSLLTQIEM